MPEEGLKFKIHVKRTLAKFDGEYEPGKQPVETITEEFDEEVDYGTYQRLAGFSGERPVRERDHAVQ